MLSLQDRPHYRSGAGVSVPLLPLLITIPFVTAVGVAWVLSFAFLHNWYLIMLMAIVAGLALGGVMYLTVGLAHCRNRWLAAVIGFCAGVIAYLGYFQCTMMHHWRGIGWQFDFLPQYIRLRMETDVHIDIAVGNAGQNKPFVVGNWIVFGIEALCITLFPAVAGFTRAARAYCSELRQWMRRDTVLLPVSSGAHLADAIESGKLLDFVAATPRVSDNQMSCKLLLEYAQPDEGSPLDYPIYASVEDFPPTRAWYRPKSLRTGLLRQV